MIKDLLQYKFQNEISPPRSVRTIYVTQRSQKDIDIYPTQTNSSPAKNVNVLAGDPKMTSDKLKFVLIGIRFPNGYNE